MALEKLPQLKTVIDLTNTYRYYNADVEFRAKSVDHVKILVEGRGIIPPASQILRFFDAIDAHLEKNKDNKDALIGVHCTHGLNRTGFFVCRWMVDRLKLDPEDAIARFNEARGHNIERQNLLDNIRTQPTLSNVDSTNKKIKETVQYQSPLDDSTFEEPSRSRYGNYNNSRRQKTEDRNDVRRRDYKLCKNEEEPRSSNESTRSRKRHRRDSRRDSGDRSNKEKRHKSREDTLRIPKSKKNNRSK